MVKFDKYGNKVDDKNFKRPSNKEDIKYRKTILLTFEKRLKQELSEDCTLCFHGTPIWNAKQIIESGNISALIDREGCGENVLPMPGQISVSTINNIWFTIKYHADLYNYNYPAGCVFVIEPKNEEEITSSREHNVIRNIYFDKEPERLKAIITTHENVEVVKAWVKASGFNICSDIVVDYDEFILFAQNIFEKPQEQNL